MSTQCSFLFDKHDANKLKIFTQRQRNGAWCGLLLR